MPKNDLTLHRFANHDIRGTIGKCVVGDILEEAKGERDGRKTGRKGGVAQTVESVKKQR